MTTVAIRAVEMLQLGIVRDGLADEIYICHEARTRAVELEYDGAITLVIAEVVTLDKFLL